MAESGLATEWALLQKEYDSYEKYALLIKLVAIAAVIATVLFGLAALAMGWMMLALSAILWFQEAIWKTFQARIEERLLVLERLLASGAGDGEAFQFNTRFLAQRGGTVSLGLEYLRNACRPTVAFPHCLLLALLATSLFTGSFTV